MTTSRTRGAAAFADTVLLLLLGAALLLPGLGAYPLWDPDDSRPAEIAREMRERDRWLVPLLQHRPYRDKPAAFYGLVRIGYETLGVGETAARLPSALATLATLGLLHRFLFARHGRRAAAIGATIFATSPLVVGLGRFCNFDASLALCITGAITAGLRALPDLVAAGPATAAHAAGGADDSPGARGARDADGPDDSQGAPGTPEGAGDRTARAAAARARLDRACAWMGVGALVKGPIGILLPLLVLTGCALLRGRAGRTLRLARPLRCAAIVLAVAAPWYALAAIRDPTYVATFLWKHNVERYVSSQADHAGHGLLYYLPVLLGGLLPWSLLAPAAVAAGRLAPGPARRAELELLVWAGIVIGFFSLSSGKLGSYVLPAFPALAGWLGARLASARIGDEGPRRWARRGVQAWFVLLVALPPVAWGVLGRRLPAVSGAAVPLFLLWPIVAALAWFWWRGRLPAIDGSRRVSTTHAVAILGVCATAMAQIFYLDVAPLISPALSDRALAHAAHQLAPGTPLIGYCVDAASISFYARRPVPRLCRDGAVVRRVERSPRLVVTRPRHAAQLVRAGVPLQLWVAGPRHSLYATFPRPDAPIEPSQPEKPS